MPNRFDDVEKEYARLRSEFEAGRLSDEEFHTALLEFAIQDAGGRFWILGANSGHWYHYDGKQWIESDANPIGSNPITNENMPPREPALIPTETLEANRSYFIVFTIASIVCFMIGVGLLTGFLESPRRFTASAGGGEQATFGVSQGAMIADVTPIPTGAPRETVAEATPTNVTQPAETPLPEELPAWVRPAIPTTPPEASNPVTTQGVIPTITPPGFRPSLTAPLSFAPGVYVTDISATANVKRSQVARLTATFFNSTGQTQRLQWRIVVVDVVSRKELTQSNLLTIPVPPGTSRFWQAFVPVTGGSGCIKLEAFAVYQQGNTRVVLHDTDGTTATAEFQAC